MNSGSVDQLPAVCVHELFEDWARRAPERVALRHEGAEMSYGELDRRANALARRLIALGAGPERRVAFLLRRGPAQIITVLAVLKAGAAYVPLDPAYPAEAIDYMLADSGASILVTQSGAEAPGLRFDGARVQLDELRDPVGPAPAVRVEIDPLNLAYIIYTSGSTGRPKGTAVSHRAMLRLWVDTNVVRLGSDETVMQYTSISFDVSVFEIWAALTQGARLVIAPGGAAALSDLGAFIKRERISLMWLTAGVFHALADADVEVFAGVRQLVVGGDVVSARHVRAVLALPTPPTVINGYGPTEAATFATFHPMRELSPEVLSVPIGGPVRHTELHVLDEDLNPVAPGDVGELYIGGPGVARGYLGAPALTADRFRPNPFSGDGGVMYATGDLVVIATDGSLILRGRNDDQVKVRGFRVELPEVEARLCRVAGVREAAVLAPRNRNGDCVLVGFLTAYPGLEINDVRAELLTQVPAYMVPTQFHVVSEMPLTGNGKVDKKALLARYRSPAGDAAPAPADADPLKAVILRHVAHELTEPASTDGNLFEFGMDSISAVRITLRLRHELNLDIPAAMIFNHPTVEGLALALRGLNGEAVALPDDSEDDTPCPLSPGQQRLWLLDRAAPGSVMYNVSGHVRLPVACEVEQLERALVSVVERHDALRTVFPIENGEPVQRVVEANVFPLPVFDLGSREQSVAEAALGSIAVEAAARSFDLATGPLYRFTMVRMPDGSVSLVAVFHHIVVDGWSISVFFRDLLVALDSECRGGPGLGEAPGSQYRRFTAWQRQFARSESARRQLDFWRTHLAGASMTVLQPSESGAEPRSAPQAVRIPVRLEGKVVADLHALARRNRTTMFVVLRAALDVQLARVSGSTDICVGVPVANRSRAEFLGIVGYLGNALAVRTLLDPEADFEGTVRVATEVMRQAHAHQDVPFEQVIEAIQPERGVSANSIVQVLFAFQNATDFMPPFVGFGLTELPGERVEAKADLVLTLIELEGALEGYFEYRASALSADHANRLAAEYVELLREVAADPRVSLRALGVSARQPTPANTGAGHRPGRDPVPATVPVARSERARLEQVVSQAWCTALGVEQVDRKTSFFDLGGNSFALARVHVLLEPHLPGLALTDLFRHPTVQAIAAAWLGEPAREQRIPHTGRRVRVPDLPVPPRPARRD
ncbi:amino acid adenylation domain-containing protein [Streptomyces sp. NPDC051639]|uniref:amino acid adenylation domain-containing protein n=1 Tax=unclassified Streptomyces TaxID=2593676 RepID=UPI002E34CC10|nr:amino acid adenylation domain-containing protein [Streptomyces sp. NBC_01717]